ncbi:MAG TPA: hypothetical protein VGL11_04710 [Candidatus Binatia bacterium]|jgi:hypothetical protein
MKKGLKCQALFSAVIIAGIFFMAGPLDAQVDKGAQGFGPPLWGPASDAGKKVTGREKTAKGGTRETYSDGSSVEFGTGVVIEKSEGVTIETIIQDSPGGKTIVVTRPDKSGYMVFPDGTGAMMDSDGNIFTIVGKCQILPDGKLIVVSENDVRSETTPSGITTIDWGHATVTRYPDGHQVYHDGTKTSTSYPDGPIEQVSKYKAGTSITFRRDGKASIEKPDGTKEEVSSEEAQRRALKIESPPETAEPRKTSAAPAVTLPNSTKYISLGDGKGATIAPDGTVILFYCPPGSNPNKPDCPPPIFQAIQKTDSEGAGTPTPTPTHQPIQKTQDNPVYQNPFGYGGPLGAPPYGGQMDPGYNPYAGPPWMPGIPLDFPSKEPREHPDKTPPWDTPPKKK